MLYCWTDKTAGTSHVKYFVYASDRCRKSKNYHWYAAALHRQANFNCSYCGLRHPSRNCPAYGQTCHNYGRRNHFAQVCRQAKLQANHIQSEDLAEVASFLVSSVDHSHNKMHETLVLTQKVTMVDRRSHHHSMLRKLDTGAQVSILPLKQFQQMSLPPLQPSNVKLHAFGKHIVKPLGKTTVKCRTLQDSVVELVFFVTEVISVPLLSEHACLTFGLLQTSYWRRQCCYAPHSWLYFSWFCWRFSWRRCLLRNTIYNFKKALLVLFSRHEK